MWDIVMNTLQNSAELALWLVSFFVFFGLLERIMPCNPHQKTSHKSIITDTLYYFVMPVVNRFVSNIYLGFGVVVVFHGNSTSDIYHHITYGYGPLSQMPIWLQAAVIFIVSDIILYWMHRGFHTSDLWPFHAIHHSSTTIGWHSTYRFHPVNVWLSFTLVDTIMMLVGFSIEAVALMGTFNMLYSAMVHANLNWTFGPFKYAFASPVFHRWHHTTQEAGMNKNFAPTFPLLDIIFGTFYMPDNVLPEHYGVSGDSIPEDFIGQMAYPFKKRRRSSLQ